MDLPIPVPSECIDFTPPSLWPVIRSFYPSGVEMPAAVPKQLWEKNCRTRYPQRHKAGEQPPPPPAFLKGYWGRLRNRALEPRRPSKKQKTSADKGTSDALPPVQAPKLCAEFWQRYFEMFPDGHRAPVQEPYGSSALGWQENSKHRLIRGSRHVNVAKRPQEIWQPSTGIDAWDEEGNWLGPG